METFSFRVTGHLCGEFTGPRWIPRTKASDAELWYAAVLKVEYTIVRLVIWDAIAPIMTSLEWILTLCILLQYIIDSSGF